MADGSFLARRLAPLLPLAALLVAFPPLGADMAYDGAEPVAVGVSVGVLAVCTVFALFANGSSHPWNRTLVRRIAWGLLVAGLVSFAVALAAYSTIGGPDCVAEEYSYREGHLCLASELPGTIPFVALMILYLFGAPFGAALLSATGTLGRGAPSWPNAKFGSRTLATLSAFAALAFMLAQLHQVLPDPDGSFAEPRTVEAAFYAVVVCLFFAPGPLALALAPRSAVARPASASAHHAIKALLALVLAALYGLVWYAAVAGGMCQERTCSGFESATLLVGAAGAPLQAVFAVLPFAFLAACGVLAFGRMRREHKAESFLTEVRSLYANGRLTRADHEEMERVVDAFGPGSGWADREFRGALLVFWSIPALVSLVIQEAFFMASSGWTQMSPWGHPLNLLSLALCGLAVAWMLVDGARRWASGRQAADEGFASLVQTHRRFIDKAGSAPAAPVRLAPRGFAP